MPALITIRHLSIIKQIAPDELQARRAVYQPWKRALFGKDNDGLSAAKHENDQEEGREQKIRVGRGGPSGEIDSYTSVSFDKKSTHAVGRDRDTCRCKISHCQIEPEVRRALIDTLVDGECEACLIIQ